MIRLLILLLIFPFCSRAQVWEEISPEIIWNKCVSLQQQGKLDSVNLKVMFYKDEFEMLDSIRQFYICLDTIKLANGYYGIGQSILDPWMEYHGRQTGEWTYYYPGGNKLATGQYEIGAFTECQAGGPTVSGYSFKVGKWKYWYENKRLMAAGFYVLGTKPQQTNCGIDSVTVSTIDEKWKFYSDTGRRTRNPQTLVSVNQLITQQL